MWLAEGRRTEKDGGDTRCIRTAGHPTPPRTLPPWPPGVEGTNYGNLKADGMLSVAIGGATGAFVGTDVSFADNWMRPLLGVEEGMSDIAGCVTAGSSTAIGFAALQTVENVAVPAGKNWVD